VNGNFGYHFLSKIRNPENFKIIFWGQNEQNQITKFLKMASHEVLENIFFEKFNKKCKNSNLELINSQNS